MERKPYYVLRLKTSKFIMHEGIAREVYPHAGYGIQLYLTDDEAERYDSRKVGKLLEPYFEITKKRCMCMPAELILYAIEKVLYEREREEEE